MVILAPQNLVMDPPFTKLDILTCRNLLIYLASDLQKKLLPLFHYSLNPGGILFLGSAETIGAGTDMFAPLPGKARLYRRVERASRAQTVQFPPVFALAQAEPAASTAEPRDPKPSANLQTLADHLLLQRYAPAAVLTTDAGDILYISGRTGKYLEPAAGKANWNIFAMAREGLRFTLGEACRKALRQKEPITLKGVKVGTNGGTQFLNITVQPVTEPEPMRGMVMFVFTDVAANVQAKPRGKGHLVSLRMASLEQMEQDLRAARSEAQTIREEMQSSQEELKSTNEELQSTNEEFQSTNEELTTSKEEMQSMNEELQTVNHELEAKVDELSWASNDMKNLLNSTDIATLFLDDALHVRRFTTHAAKLIRLIPGDAGRPITDIASTLVYPTLTEEVKEVMRTLVFKEKPVCDNSGNWFMVRIMPYRTHENKIDGVVITFTDIAASKKLESSLHEAVQRMDSILQNISDPCFALDNNLDVTSVNPAAQRMLGRKSTDVVGKSFFDVLPGTRGGIFDQKYHNAVKEKMPVTFEAQLDVAPYQGAYNVCVYPQREGISVFLQPRDANVAVAESQAVIREPKT